MNLQLSYSAEKVPAELLDTLVVNRRANGQASVSVQFLCHWKTNGTQTANDRMSLPPLSWFDANLLQSFTKQLAGNRPEHCEIELPDSGLRLTAHSGRRVADARAIRVEPLPGAARQFVPFTLNGTQADIRTYARRLYNQLWEVFCRG